MEKFIVPKRWQKAAWRSQIRLKLEKKFPDEQVEFVYITSQMKCLVTTAKLIPHENHNRIEFETEEHHHEYDVVPRKCAEVMEG